MYGDEAEKKTPRAIRKMLEEYGGKTPTGLPLWRLVQAGDCTILCQGRIHHFPRGVELDVNVRPDRIGGGVLLLPRYRDIAPTDWILQRWFHPRVWGTAVEWKFHRTEDPDTPLFVQTFPANGDYFMLAGPWHSIEEVGDLRQAIHIYLKREQAKRRDTESFVRERMAEEAGRRAQDLAKLEVEIMRAEAALEPVLKSVSPDAQKVRDKIAAQAGLTGHLGASEAWG